MAEVGHGGPSAPPCQRFLEPVAKPQAYPRGCLGKDERALGGFAC